MQTRVCSPYGEHFVCVGENAPNELEEDHTYTQMFRVREFDTIMRTRDPEYEPPTDGR